MILYTILDPGFVLSDGPYAQQEASSGFSELKVDGITVQVAQINEKQVRVERIISTNPLDYLNARVQPGAIIENRR